MHTNSPSVCTVLSTVIVFKVFLNLVLRIGYFCKYTAMREYYILTLDPQIGPVFRFIELHQLRFEAHLNRTRFWVPDGPVLTEFLLRFSECCPRVDANCDLATGLPVVQAAER